MPVQEEFIAQAAPFRAELIAHCYRMLGSVHDAEDLVQETYLRGWRGYANFEERAALRTWLYRIATTACLRALENRARRVLPAGLGAGSVDPDVDLDGGGCSASVARAAPRHVYAGVGVHGATQRAAGSGHRDAGAARPSARRSDPAGRGAVQRGRGRRAAGDHPGGGQQRTAAGARAPGRDRAHRGRRGRSGRRCAAAHCSTGIARPSRPATSRPSPSYCARTSNSKCRPTPCGSTDATR